MLPEMLFADAAALVSHTQEGCQRLISCLAHPCKECGLTISLNKTNMMGQNGSKVPSIYIGDYTLKVVEVSITLVLQSPATCPLKPRLASASANQLLPCRLSKRDWEKEEQDLGVQCLVCWPSNAALQGRVEEVRRDQSQQWKVAGADHSSWCRVVRTGVKRAEAKREYLWHDKREQQRTRETSIHSLPTAYKQQLKNWTLQSQSTLHQYSKLTFLAQTIVFRDRGRQHVWNRREEQESAYPNDMFIY